MTLCKLLLEIRKLELLRIVSTNEFLQFHYAVCFIFAHSGVLIYFDQVFFQAVTTMPPV